MKKTPSLHELVRSGDLGDVRALLALLELLIANGVSLSGVSSYHESGLRVLSNVGRFESVFLFDARRCVWSARE